MIRLTFGSVFGIVIGLVAQITFAQNAKPVLKREPSRPVKSPQPAKPASGSSSPSKPADPSTKPAKPTGDPTAKTSSTKADATQLPTQATVEMIMNEAVKNIARRYNLNEAQTQKTDEIMKREVNKFLKDHEAEVWPVIRDLIASGFGTKPPQNPDEIKRIGKAAEPLLKLAKDAVHKGNEEWRQYLDEGQKATHDYDLGEMDKTFSQIERNFHSWAEGKPVDGGIFPPPPADRSPTPPRQPPPGLPKPEVEIFVRTTLFDTVVEDFIREYELDPAQIDAARSILSEFKSKAGDFKEANRAELSKIAGDLKNATDAHDLDRIAKAEADRKKLMQPVYELFAQMDERLKALLTTSQVELHATKQAAASADKTPNPQKEKTPVADKSAAHPTPGTTPAGGKPAEPAKPAPAPEAKPVSGDKPAPSETPPAPDRG